MADLSPASQRLVDAFRDASDGHYRNGEWIQHTETQLAAVLRALADQVVPTTDLAPQGDIESRREAMIWGMRNQTQLTRQHILAIAAELEGGR